MPVGLPTGKIFLSVQTRQKNTFRQVWIMYCHTKSTGKSNFSDREKHYSVKNIFYQAYRQNKKKIPVKSKLTEQCMLYPGKREFFCQE